MTSIRRQGKRPLWAFVISVALVLVFSGVAYLLPALASLAIIAVPGMLGAAVFFPQGGHSDWAYAYVLLAVVIDGALYTWPVLILWRYLAASFSK